jgi:hypothetical protein
MTQKAMSTWFGARSRGKGKKVRARKHKKGGHRAAPIIPPRIFIAGLQPIHIHDS